jgi:hypothetical protein
LSARFHFWSFQTVHPEKGQTPVFRFIERRLVDCQGSERAILGIFMGFVHKSWWFGFLKSATTTARMYIVTGVSMRFHLWHFHTVQLPKSIFRLILKTATPVLADCQRSGRAIIIFGSYHAMRP